MNSVQGQHHWKLGGGLRKGRPFFLLALLTALAYSNSLNGEFIFDDKFYVSKPIMESLWPPWKFFGLNDERISRPTLYFSLALNFAISGQKVWSYHLFNLVVHIFNTFLVFLIVTQIFFSKALRKRFARVSKKLAFFITLIWAIHPIQTMAVSYIIQRSESLMALFYLLTWYFAIRGWNDPLKKKFWHFFALVSFLFGSGTKEIIIVAPVVIFLYRWLCSDLPFKTILKESMFLVAGFCVCLILQITFFLFSSNGLRLMNSEFSTVAYILNQPKVVFLYLSLLCYPKNLCLDYNGWPHYSLENLFPFWFGLFVLLGFFFFQTVRRNPSAFLGVWFFFNLAPTSLIPLPNIVDEYRMYLPSIAPITLVGVVFFQIHSFLTSRFSLYPSFRRAIESLFLGIFIVLIGLLGWATFLRNEDYREAVAIWKDTVQKNPKNGRAFHNLGEAYLNKDNDVLAMQCFREGLRVSPGDFNIHQKLSWLGCKSGNFHEAERFCRQGIKLLKNWLERNGIPDLSDSRGNPLEKNGNSYLHFRVNQYRSLHFLLGDILWRQKKFEEAVWPLEEALRIDPKDSQTHEKLGVVFSEMVEKRNDALFHYQEALKFNPNGPSIHLNLGMLLFEMGQQGEAISQFREAIKLDPKLIEGYLNLGVALLKTNQTQEGLQQIQTAYCLDPKNANVQQTINQLGARFISLKSESMSMNPGFSGPGNSASSAEILSPK